MATITYHPEPVAGYRHGSDFYLPLANLAPLGWTASVQKDSVRIVTDESTYSLPLRRVQAHPCISLLELAKKTHADAKFAADYGNFNYMSPLLGVKGRDGKVLIETRVAVMPRVQTLSAPPRVIIDLEGARLSPKAIYDLGSGTKVEPYGLNCVRVTLPLSDPDFSKMKLAPGSRLEFDFSPPPPVVITPPPVEQSENPSVSPPNNGPNELALRVQVDGPMSTLLTLNSPTAALKGKPIFRKPEPDVLEITLPGVLAEFPAEFQSPTEAVRRISSETVGNSTRVRLELAAAMGGEVWTDAQGAVIQLIRPAIANGKIAGKVIVIDPGHGGIDSGCTFGSLKEKDLALMIAKDAVAELARLGVTVIMTRKDDSFPSLKARPDLANRNRADMFVSIHINSPGGRGNGPSGTQVYYHRSDATSRLMGECIMKYMVQHGKMPNLGVRSDLTLHPQSGLAVLRDSRMPAVLVEVGFITNPADRARLVNAEFRRTAAQAIVRGIRLFLGDKP